MFAIDRAIMEGESVTRTSGIRTTSKTPERLLVPCHHLALRAKNETVGPRTSHTGQTSGGRVYWSGANERIFHVIGLVEARVYGGSLAGLGQGPASTLRNEMRG